MNQEKTIIRSAWPVPGMHSTPRGTETLAGENPAAVVPAKGAPASEAIVEKGHWMYLARALAIRFGSPLAGIWAAYSSPARR